MTDNHCSQMLVDDLNNQECLSEREKVKVGLGHKAVETQDKGHLFTTYIIIFMKCRSGGVRASCCGRGGVVEGQKEGGRRLVSR